MSQNNDVLNAKLTSVNQQVTGNAPAKAKDRSIAHYLDQSRPEFEKALIGSGMDASRFARICLTLIRNSDALTQIAVVNPLSVLAACMEIAALGLDPSIPNETYIIPYGKEAKQQTGYKGLAKLALRAAREEGCPLETFTYDTICEGDIYDRVRGDRPYLRHALPPFGTPRGKLIGFYATSRNSDGAVNFVEMTVDEVKDHQKRFCKSMSNSKSPFYQGNNFEAYGLKTVVRRLVSKYLPMSSRLAQATASDMDEEDAIEAPAVVVKPELPDILLEGEGEIEVVSE